MAHKILSRLARRLSRPPELRWQGASPNLSAWYEGKEFTSDWLTHSIESWLAALAPFRDAPARVLDIGSYEGRSAVTFLELLQKAQVVSMDQFAYGDPDMGPIIEARFDRNVQAYGDRIKKIKGPAAATLDQLRRQNETFDVIYADAGKRRDWVFALSALAWPLLNVGGVMIWDDLQWGRDRPRAQRPKDAILLFAKAFGSSLEVLHESKQLIVRKTHDWPKM